MNAYTQIAWSKVKGSPVLRQILDDWLKLLADTSQLEPAYQKFLSDHAGFFFPRPSEISGDQLVLEKTALGGDHITDFVNLNGNRSAGPSYTLIEIESPHDALYTRGGIPTSHFNHALQQVRDWKRWITANIDSAKKLFPSKQFLVTGVPSIDFLIVIGRRDNDQVELEKRNQILRDECIKVRSFDYLTDVFHARIPKSFSWISRDLETIGDDQNNQFSNPFFTATADSKWRAMLPQFSPIHSHTVGKNIGIILANRTYNDNRADAFVSWVEKQGLNTIEDWERELITMT